MKLDRRTFIRLIPIGMAAALAGGSWWFFRELASRQIIHSEATVTTSATLQATPTTTSALQIESTTSVAPQPVLTTPEAFDFPVTWNGDQPTKVDKNKYRLKIDGDVSEPLELTLEDLYAMSNVQKTLEIGCVLGWRANVPWEGIPLIRLLSLAGAPQRIAQVTVESLTGYGTTMSQEDEVANPDCMIALKAGGVPLSVEHGYPARLVAPKKAGLDWVKYVTRITCKGM
jgi:DMSO/TMAO reductase YedYZ molybdopterin-dependent catalytic subunit